MEQIRQDGIAEMIREDAVAELEQPTAGIAISLNANCGIFCHSCQRPLRSENVKVLVTPPHEFAEEPEYIEERRLVLLICRQCDGEVLRFETRLHFQS